jgi:hypothetical protein
MSGLFPIFQNGKLGYINSAGRVILPPKFQGAGSGILFSEGLACVSVDGKTLGYIDKKGHFAIPPRFERCTFFSEGLAAVSLHRKLGFVNRYGRMVIPPSFDPTEDSEFSNGLAIVRQGGKCGYIDKSGKYLVSPQFSFCEPFVESVTTATVLPGGGQSDLTFIDRNGNVLGDPALAAATFTSGLAPVRLGTKWGYVNKEGKLVIDARFDEASLFDSGGLASVLLRGKLLIIDRSGRTFFDTGIGNLSSTSAPSFNFFAISMWIAGRMQMAPFGMFSEGVTPVADRDKWGYIDRTAHYVIRPQFDGAAPFIDGLAAVAVSDGTPINKIGWINKTGNYVWVPTK